MSLSESRVLELRYHSSSAIFNNIREVLGEPDAQLVIEVAGDLFSGKSVKTRASELVRL